MQQQTLALQASGQRETTAREYVGIAVTVLSNKDADRELRQVAAILFKKFSPIHVSRRLFEGLKSGTVTLPGPPSISSISKSLTHQGVALHGGSIWLECAGPSDNPHDPVRLGETITCTIQFTSAPSDIMRVDSIEDVLKRPSGDVPSGNLLLSPVTLAGGQAITVTHKHPAAPEDVNQGYIYDLGKVTGVTTQLGGTKQPHQPLPFVFSSPGRVKVLEP